MLFWRARRGEEKGGKKVQINILDLFQVIKQQSLITRSNNLPALITTAIVKCQSEKQYKQSVTLPINTVAIKNISDISASLPPAFAFFAFFFLPLFYFIFLFHLRCEMKPRRLPGSSVGRRRGKHKVTGCLMEPMEEIMEGKATKKRRLICLLSDRRRRSQPRKP